MDLRAYRADALLLLAAVIWGCAFVAQRAGMGHMGPMAFNAVRFALGAAVLVPLALRRGALVDPHGQRTPKGNPSYMVGGGLAGFVLFAAATLQQVGLVHTTAGKAGFITGLYVIIVPLLGLLWGHRPGRGGWCGALLATAGLYLLSVRETLTFAPGDLWELVGALFWAAHLLILGWLSPKMRGVHLACVQYGVCSLLSFISALFVETLTLEGLMGAGIPILYAGMLSVGVGFTLQVFGQKEAPAVHAAIILSMEAVFAALAGWIILGETLATRELLGCGLMLGGMLTAQLWS